MVPTKTPHKGEQTQQSKPQPQTTQQQREKTSKEKAPLVRALKFKLEQLGFTPKRREP